MQHCKSQTNHRQILQTQRTENHYCACCHRTQPFRDMEDVLFCPVCSRKLWRRIRTDIH